MQISSNRRSRLRCNSSPLPSQVEDAKQFQYQVKFQGTPYPSLWPGNTRLWYTIRYHTILCNSYIYIHDCTILHCTMREYSTYYTILYHIILYYTLLYRTVSHYIILYNIAPYRTILYGSVLYYIIFYWLVIYYTRRSFQSIERVRTPIDSSIFNLLNHPAFLPSLLRRSRQSAECVTYVIRTSPTYGKPHPKHNPFI